MTSEDKMREALEFYADPTNWVSGDVPGHVYAIEDAGGIAREALKDQPKMEPVGWWDGDSRFTRHETLPQKHSWDVVHPLYIVPPAALHSVEAEKGDQWKASGYQYPTAMSHNPDAKAWADFFMATFPNCGADPDIMLGWFANAMMAVHDHMVSEAEKEPDWISCDERLPTEDDTDNDGCVWVFWDDRGPCIDRERFEDAADYKYWMSTGLVRPAPPEHKPGDRGIG